MLNIRRILGIFVIVGFVLCLFGCGSKFARKKQPKVYFFPEVEAEWIRNGQPIEFEAEQWYPQDSVDILLDQEVYWIGSYNDTEVFDEKADVRPYNRIYTKFGKNKFRVFTKKEE